jgi:uncharacterized protein YbjQ (UPF0145 family)
MKKLVFSIIGLALSLPVVLPASAADEVLMMPVAAAMQTGQEKLGDNVKFYFAGQNHPKVITKLGTDSTNKKTNGFNKTAEHACSIAFMSAILQMQKRAEALGANAVINIVSYYKKNEVKSATEYECHNGGFMTGVALKGDFVKVAGK